MPTVKIKRLDSELPLPSYAYPGDAAFDVYAAETKTLLPQKRHSFRTGLSLEIPEGYVGLVWDKSGLAIRQGLKTLGGVIDCGYRGELLVGMINLSSEPYTIERGNKIAQMVIQKKETVTLEEVQELSPSERAEKGFGSSGK